MGITDDISRFLYEALHEGDGILELQRSNLAERFRCVPSQINYVIATRFAPELGYIVQSRRGGGGYIRITRVPMTPDGLLMHTVNVIGEEIDARSAVALLNNIIETGGLDVRVAAVIAAAVSENSLRAIEVSKRDTIRAAILKNCLLQCV